MTETSAPTGDQMPTLPRLGDPAPGFEAESTQGPLALEDFRGSWVVLFSHPADFTPVCTTEFLAFARIEPALKARNTELLGLSIDSVYSHLAWLSAIRQHFGVEIPFPVIADADRSVARLYGMVMPEQAGTETSRCVFVIDPEGIVRAMIYYPLTTGRNSDEILRLIDALQATDRHGIATPADWRPGDRGILPPPRTVEDAAQRMEGEQPGRVDWWFCPSDIPDRTD